MSRSLTKEQAERVLHRDGFACRCCGFTSRKFQRVIPWAASAEEGEGGFITVCTFCESCQELDRAGLAGTGTLIWLPEMSQAELNHLARAIYVARATSDPLAAAASRALEILLGRRTEAKKRLGTDDPLLLATALQENVDEKTYAARAAKLEGVRFLPADRFFVKRPGGDVDIFPQMLVYWTSPEGPFGTKPVSEWTSLFDRVRENVKA